MTQRRWGKSEHEEKPIFQNGVNVLWFGDFGPTDTNMWMIIIII